MEQIHYLFTILVLFQIGISIFSQPLLSHSLKMMDECMITFGNVVLGTHVSFMCKIIRKGIHNSTTKEGIEELKIMQA